MAIYMHIPDIQGNVESKNYSGWIELLDAGFGGVSNTTRMLTGKTMDRFNTCPAFRQVVLAKSMDISSPHLFEASHSQTVFPYIEIHYVQTGSQLFTYAKTRLSHVAVTHYSEGHRNSAEGPEEIIRLAYTQVERTYIPRGRDHQAGSPIITGYNLEQAEKL